MNDGKHCSGSVPCTEVKFQIPIVFFVLAMILLVCILKHLKRGDIFAERQQRNKEENTDRMRPSLFGAGV